MQLHFPYQEGEGWEPKHNKQDNQNQEDFSSEAQFPNQSPVSYEQCSFSLLCIEYRLFKKKKMYLRYESSPYSCLSLIAVL